MTSAWLMLAGQIAPEVSVSSAVTGPSFSEALVRMLVTLVTVVVLLLVAARYLPRMIGRLRSGSVGSNGQPGPGEVRVKSSLQLSPSHRLVVIVAEGRRLLLSVGPGTAELVCELGAGGEDADADAEVTIGREVAGSGGSDGQPVDPRGVRSFQEFMKSRERPSPETGAGAPAPRPDP